MSALDQPEEIRCLDDKSDGNKHKVSEQQVSLKPNKRVGEKIAILRVKVGFSRSKLVEQVHTLLPLEDPLRTIITESVIREIEEGNRVNLPRAMLEILCMALKCSESQRFEIMLLADRNAFANSVGETATATETLMRAIAAISAADSIVQTQIEVLLNNRNANMLNEDELIEILEKIVQMASVRRKKDRQQGSAPRIRLPTG